MKKIFYTAFYFCSTLLMSSCIGDLDQYPHEEETSSTELSGQYAHHTATYTCFAGIPEVYIQSPVCS